MKTTKHGKSADYPEGRARRRLTPGALQALAERLCPHKTDSELHNELVPGSGRRLTPDEAVANAIDRVAAVVARTCEWGQPITDWGVGDHRFLVLECWPTKRACLYVQIWTEPGEPVLIEVCSGAWTPEARKYVREPQRAALRARGYKVGGQARNFQKEWTLSPLADFRALANELLAVLTEVLGYRGTRALGMVYCSQGRTTAGQVFPSLAIDDVKRMLGIGGCRVVSAEPVGPVKPSVKRRLIHVDQPFPFVVEVRVQSGKTPATYDAIRFITALPGGQGVSNAQLEVMTRECPFARIFRDDGGEVLLLHDVLAAGTTVRWFLMTLHIWKRTRQRATEMVQLALAAPAPHGSGNSGGPGDEDDPDDVGLDGGDDDGGEEPRQSEPARTVVH
jgi:hypothetical protein